MKARKKHLTWRQMVGALIGAGFGLGAFVGFAGWTWFNVVIAVGLLAALGLAAHDKWRDEKN